MEAEGPRLLRLEEKAGPVRPIKNPGELVSECFMLTRGQRVGRQGWLCVETDRREVAGRGSLLSLVIGLP